ncbi:hypothetical protein, partial [Dietzia maris]|uniref:hypothetical protein n=1 Tax=Dietzia maris TaxID=37915 RepID=UPI00223BAFE1
MVPASPTSSPSFATAILAGAFAAAVLPAGVFSAELLALTVLPASLAEPVRSSSLSSSSST